MLFFCNTLSLLCLQALARKQSKAESGGGGGPGEEGGGWTDGEPSEARKKKVGKEQHAGVTQVYHRGNHTFTSRGPREHLKN